MDYSNKAAYHAGNANYSSGIIKYKSNALCEKGCAYCTGCASAYGGINFAQGK